MKNIKFFGLLSIAALAMSVSSCTNDNEPVISENETGNNTESGVFTIKANIGELQQTRATVKPEDGKSFTWQQNDVFDLYLTPGMTANTFTIDNNSISSDGKSADFNCSSFAPVEGETFYAFYPQGFTITDNKTFTYTIPDDVYTQAGDNNTDHLNKGMIMIATGKSADIQNSVTFKHKTALFRFGISNLKSEEVTVKTIKLYSTDLECFATKYSYNIDGTETIEEKSNTLTLNFANGGISLASGNAIKAYTLAIPADAIAEEGSQIFTLEVTYGDNSTITNKIELNNKTIDGEKINQSFEPGKVYTFYIDIDYNRYYISGNYNGWSWEKCQYIYDTNLDGIYEGRVYFDSNGEDVQYEFKITQYKNWIKSWGGVWDDKNDNIKKDKRSCMVQVKPENGTENVYTWDDVDFWGLVGGFNSWGEDIEMVYGFDGDHYLIAENIEFNDETDLKWKIRSDKIWSTNENPTPEIDSTSDIIIEGPVERTNERNNLRVTAGAGTYEFKWYFNLPQPKIVVTKK